MITLLINPAGLLFCKAFAGENYNSLLTFHPESKSHEHKLVLPVIRLDRMNNRFYNMSTRLSKFFLTYVNILRTVMAHAQSRYLVFQFFGGENREKGWTGMVYLPSGRCEGSPDPSEVSSLRKLSVFSKSPIGTFGTPFITVLGMLPLHRKRYPLHTHGTLMIWGVFSVFVMEK